MARKRKSPSKAPGSRAPRARAPPKKAKLKAKMVEEEDPEMEIYEDEADLEEICEVEEEEGPSAKPSRSNLRKKSKVKVVEKTESRFTGAPVDDKEARKRWPHRYVFKGKGKEVAGSVSLEDKIQARRHFTKAVVDGNTHFELGNEAYVAAGEGEDDFICRIIEMFEGEDGVSYITAQWFYRAKDTVIRNCSELVDDKRVFLSTIKDDNHLDCLLKKIIIVEVPLEADLDTKMATISGADYYYDMMYDVPFSSFRSIQHVNKVDGFESDSKPESDSAGFESDSTLSSDTEAPKVKEPRKVGDMFLLDLYAGCGAMSTGLGLGAHVAGGRLITKWAVDFNEFACQSLKLNHPDTEVRHEKADDFLALLKHWQQLVKYYVLSGEFERQHMADKENESNADDAEEEVDPESYVVEKVLSICYGDPNWTKKRGVYLKIRWENYDESYDTWEPLDGLSDCKEKIKEFITNGYNSKILPMPGDVDVICGGPPCQGISGFNRFRNKNKPLDDPKNEQVIVFMDIVNYLQPRFVLMENVVDILKFAKGFLGRYALGRLVGMNYQARMGIMVAGAYGLPQFRQRMFMWGAHPTEKLPQYPLPTHGVVVRGNIPKEFESNAVVYDEGNVVQLQEKLYLGDALSDLPPVENDETRDEMEYGSDPTTPFQHFIRLKKEEMPGFPIAKGLELSKPVLFDHRPLKLNVDDYQRVCLIPVKKGANFRDMGGVRVGANNKVELDPNVQRVYLRSGKPLIPNYALSYIEGTSLKPFSRLWWDETIPTVVTRAEPHNQTILHPHQNRVLTIRENARLQGFPDFYQLRGPVRERYIQVGNAVAVPVARALGYSLMFAVTGSSTTDGPLITLPYNFPHIENP